MALRALREGEIEALGLRGVRVAAELRELVGDRVRLPLVGALKRRVDAAARDLAGRYEQNYVRQCLDIFYREVLR